jgi:mycothiol system anti-sigma-R factor
MGDCNCEEALKELQRYLDGELDAPDRADIQRHLSDCNPCMNRAEFRQNLKVMISSKCVETAVPHDLLEKIHSLIADPATPAG